MNKNKYHKEYYKKHPELKEYNKLWMRAFRHKTKKPILNIISDKTRNTPEFFKAKDKCKRCGVKTGKDYYYTELHLLNGKTYCIDCYNFLKNEE